MKKPTKRTDLRIVDQTRRMDARQYDFAHEERRLTLKMTLVSSLEGVRSWNIEAIARPSPQDEVITLGGSGATRTEALRALGRSWQETETGLRMFDWEALENLLTEVRALE